MKGVRKRKEEQAAWFAEQAKIETNEITYEKKLEIQLFSGKTHRLSSVETLRKTVTVKIHFVTFSKATPLYQRKTNIIVRRSMPSDNSSDSKVAIPLIKMVTAIMPKHFMAALSDAGYDYEPIYKQALVEMICVVIPQNV